MNNAERFLNTYNEIDRYLKSYESGRYETYSDKIRHSRIPVIRKFKDRLLDYGELRNAIVHTPRAGNGYIAIPLDSAVADFEEIGRKLQNPERVFPRFRFEVKGVKHHEKLAGVLQMMRQHSFSQIPVFDDSRHVIEVINSNTVARWLARNINSDGIIENPAVSALFGDIECRKNYQFIARDCDIYTACNLFSEQIEKRHRHLDALFITSSGSPDERLIGLITVADMAELLA